MEQMMLHNYKAEVHGTQLIWIDQPPAPLERRRVMVVIEDSPFSQLNPPMTVCKTFFRHAAAWARPVVSKC